MSQYVFVYGTLKQGHGNHHYLSHANYVGPAYTVADNYTMYEGGFPCVVTTGKFHVMGELYHVDDEQIMENLDRLEGVPTLFDRHETVVNADGEEYNAIMYVAAKDTQKYFSERRPQVIPNDKNMCWWR